MEIDLTYIQILILKLIGKNNEEAGSSDRISFLDKL